MERLKESQVRAHTVRLLKEMQCDSKETSRRLNSITYQTAKQWDSQNRRFLVRHKWSSVRQF